MFTLILRLSIFANDLLQRYAPTNRLLWFLRRRENLRYGTLAMLLAIPYLLIGRGIIALIDIGAPEWLYLIFMLMFWNAVKMVAIGPVSLMLLAKARWREARAAKRANPEQVKREQAAQKRPERERAGTRQ